MSSEDEQFEFFNDDDLPPRTSSAPPMLEMQESSLFAMGNNYAPFFASRTADIRLDEDYLAFYQSYDNPSKLPPPLSSFGGMDDIFEREQYSPVDSPRLPRALLPRNFDGHGNGSPRTWRPLPKRLASVSSLEEYTLGCSAEDLLPDLSSDSESVCSSVEDISTLMKNMGMNGNGAIGPEKFGANRFLWDGETETIRDTPTPPILPSAGAPGNGNNVPLPPGLTVNSIEQSLGEAEIASDVPSQRRREPQRGQNTAIGVTVPCRYFVQGYCSRGDRCNFAHVSLDPSAIDSTSSPTSTSPSQLPVPSPTIPISAPKPISKTAQTHLNVNGTMNQAHRRRHSASTVQVPSVAATAAAAISNNTTFTMGRFTSIDQVIGQIYPMCKDQHGCRFLQKKLDEKAPQVVDAIFNEIHQHFGELMTDPFGNYLCQKLLEHCSDKQRLQLIDSVANDLVRISQNMHGTRAVQKMIECLHNPQEIRLVTRGLRLSVVQLIKDLNGNHVVQRCLNHLSSQDNQFIYDAVAGHCVEVATHRHGCCVLQRCIDHASETQKYQLVGEITVNGLTLVKDPYGNYVVQYVLDLPYPRLIAGLALQFSSHLAELSTQKFSSNVVEKCLNVSDPATRAWMIKELTETEHLKSLIQDPFGNYVIQTAMSVADPVQYQRLVEGIKPFLYALRNTPYGKRIQNRILKDAQHMRNAPNVHAAGTNGEGHHKYHHK